MFIDFDKLDAAGYGVASQKDGVYIEPKNGSDKLGRSIFNLLESGSCIGSDAAETLAEQTIKKVQVLEIVKIISE